MSEIQPAITREEFIANVQKWATLDTQLKIVHEKTKKMRELKSELARQICDYIETNQIKSSVALSDGELRVYEKREYSPLSYSYIQTCLEQIIKNPDHIAYIIQYLKDHREVKVVQDLRRIHINK